MQVPQLLLNGLSGEKLARSFDRSLTFHSYMQYPSLQTKDWKKVHKDECGILKAIFRACPDQDTTFARLFVRSGLKVNVSISFSYIDSTTEKLSRVNYKKKLFWFLQNDLKEMGMWSMPCFIPESLSKQNAEQCLKLYHQPQNCRKLFNTWTPIVQALDRHHSTNQRQFGCFMNALTDLIGISMPMYATDQRFSQEPIAYCTFLNKTATPFCVANAVFVPVVDPVYGPILQVKAVRPVKAGEMVRFKI